MPLMKILVNFQIKDDFMTIKKLWCTVGMIETVMNMTLTQFQIPAWEMCIFQDRLKICGMWNL